MGFSASSFAYRYRFPTMGTDAPLGSDAKEIAVPRLDAGDSFSTSATVDGTQLYTLQFTDRILRFDFEKSALWTTGYKDPETNQLSPVQFNGPMLVDYNGTLPDIMNVTMKTNIAGLNAKDLKFDANHVSLDFTGILSSPTSFISLTFTFNDPIVGDDRSNVLHGNAFNNIIKAGRGDDVTIDGGGADKIDGGAGNDTASYVESSAGVTASLKSPALNTNDAKGDTYISVENLSGSNFSDKLFGDGNANKLLGNAGNDRLSGGLGHDLLAGGSGRDTFVFDSKLGSLNVDTIDDFNVAADTILLDHDIFTRAGSIGDLASAAFYAGTKAHDSSDRIIYDKATGKLWYDDDGTGAHSAVLFAQLGKGLGLTASDFDIIG